MDSHAEKSMLADLRTLLAKSLNKKDLRTAVKISLEIYKTHGKSADDVSNHIYILTASELLSEAERIIMENFRSLGTHPLFLINSSNFFIRTKNEKWLSKIFLSSTRTAEKEPATLTLNRLQFYLEYRYLNLSDEIFSKRIMFHNEPKHPLYVHFATLYSAHLLLVEDFHALEEYNVLDPFGRPRGISIDTHNFYLNKAFGLVGNNKYFEALGVFESLLKLKPNDPGLMGACLYFSGKINDLTRTNELLMQVKASILRGVPVISPFYLLAFTDDPELQHLAAKHWVEKKLGLLPEKQEITSPSNCRSSDLLKLGFLSSDFHDHATMELLADVLVELGKKNDVYLLSIGVRNLVGTKYEYLLKSGLKFFDLATLSDSDAAEAIKKLGITHLFDVKGHCQGARQGILRQRLANFQINYLAYPGTSAMPSMDFIIADRFLIDSTAHQAYSEDIIKLSTCYQPNNRLSEEEKNLRAKDLSGQRVSIIGCFNASYKITPQIFLQWLRVLRAIPSLELYLLGDSTHGRGNLFEYARKKGFVNEFKRVTHLPKTDRAGYLKYFRLIDLFVDTFPYGAHTTASDCLRMATPIVTLAGKSFASRVCGSLLHHIDVPELVTHDLESYAQKIIRLCSEKSYFERIAVKLVDNRQVLYDSSTYSKRLVQALPK
jgi:protein O-GlcNAc transferase